MFPNVALGWGRSVLVGLAIVALSGGLSAAAMVLVLRYAKRMRLVQAPNGRSSHRSPTPAGGGIGIAGGATLAALFVAAGQSWPTVWIIGFGLLLAGVGLWDDISPQPAALRLGAQLAAVAGTLALVFSPFALANAFGLGIVPDPVLLAALSLVLVYWINLFNFMDGIDGLAGSEAVFLLMAPVVLALLDGFGVASTPFYWWVLATATATAVFLAFNWQPARIFMGDAGSLFLGFVTAIFGLIELVGGWISPWELAILPACFFTDATVTLVRRAAQGEALMTAHRRHAYQRLARRFDSHRRVTLGVTAVNVAWLLPLAVVAHLRPEFGPELAALAYLPLVVAVVLAGAGRSEHA